MELETRFSTRKLVDVQRPDAYSTMIHVPNKSSAFTLFQVQLNVSSKCACRNHVRKIQHVDKNR
jgi:hypothetical protein